MPGGCPTAGFAQMFCKSNLKGREYFPGGGLKDVNICAEERIYVIKHNFAAEIRGFVCFVWGDVSAACVAGVVLQYFVTKHGAVEVYVYFGGGYAFVSEHLLDCPEVGSSFKEVCGEGVAECVG